MADILHRLIIETTPDKLYQALTDEKGLSAWWTKTDTTGKLGSTAQFSFGPKGDHKMEMKITALVPDKKVEWQCVAGPWVDTGKFSFEIQPNDRGSVLLFAHCGWNQPSEDFMHCNSKWGYFLVVSLKSYLETGTGKPHPQDPNI